MDASKTVFRATARLWQRIGAQLIMVGAFFGLTYLLLYFLINSGFTGRIFDDTVNTQFRGRIGWTRVSFGPLPWQVKLFEPVLMGADGRAVVYARSVAVEEVELLALLSGTIRLRGVHLEAPVVRLQQRLHPFAVDEFEQPEAVFNVVEMFQSPGLTAPDDGQPVPRLRLSVRDLSASDGQFVLDMPVVHVKGAHINLSGGKFELDISNPDSMQIRVSLASAGRLSVDVAHTDLDVPAIHAPPRSRLSWRLRETRIQGFNWRDNQFRVQSALSRVQGDDVVRIRPFRMWLDTPGMPAMSLEASLQVADIAEWLPSVGLLTEDVPSLAGAVDVQVRASGQLDSMTAHIELLGRRLRMDEVQIERVSLVAQKDDRDRLVIESVEIFQAGSAVTGRGDFELEAGHGALTLQVNDFDPATLPIALPELVADELGGRVWGRVTVRARDLYRPSRRVSSDLRLHLRRKVRGVGLPRALRVDAALAYADDVLSVFEGSVRADGRDPTRDAGVRVRLKGRLASDGAHPMTLAFRGDVRVPQLAAFAETAGQPIAGQVNAAFKLQGDVRAPRVKLDISGEALRYAGSPPARLRTQLTITPQVAMIANLALTTVVGQVSAAGRIGLEDGRLGLEVKASRVRLGRLPLPVDVGGLLSAQLTVRGHADAPHVRGSLKVRRPRFRGLRVDRIELEAGWDGRTFDLPRLSVLDQGRTLLDVKGWLEPFYRGADGRVGRFDGRAMVNQVPLSLLDPLLAEPLPVTGILSAEFGGAGALSDPQGKGELSLRDLVFGGLKLGDVTLGFEAGGETLSVRGRALDHFTLFAAIPTATPTAGGRPAELTVTFDDFSVESLLPDLATAGLRTRISGQVTAGVDLFEGALLGVGVSLSELMVGFGHLTLEAAAPVRLSHRHGVTVIEQLKLEGPGQRIELTGSLGDDGQLDVDLRGAVDLSLLGPFLKTQFAQVEGKAAFDLTLSGGLEDPAPDGTLTILEAELSPRSGIIGREIELAERVTFEIQRPVGPLFSADGVPMTGVFSVVLSPRSRLRLLRDDTPIDISRLEAHFVSFMPSSIRVEGEADALSVSIPRTLRAVVNARNLRFEMWEDIAEDRLPETRLLLAGDLEVLNGEYMADHASASEINRGFTDNLRGTAQQDGVNALEASPILKRLFLDLRLQIDNDFFIRNHVTVIETNLEIRADLRARGFLASLPTDAADEGLTLDGRVEILPDSEITYARRAFEVSSGAVAFGGAQFLKAELEASHTFRLSTDAGSVGTFTQGSGGDIRLEEVTLFARLLMASRDDKLPQFQLELSSSSGASQIEVATLVLTGRYPSELTGASSAQPATEVLLGPLLGLIERPIEETLDLDSLTLSPDAAGTLTIEADKLLLRRLRLYTHTPVGSDDTTDLQTFGLEYQLNNVTFGELTEERRANLSSTTIRLRLKLDLD